MPDEITDTNAPTPNSQSPIDNDMRRTTGGSLRVHAMFKKLPSTCQYALTVLIVLILIASLCALLLGGWFLVQHIKGNLSTTSLLHQKEVSLEYTFLVRLSLCMPGDQPERKRTPTRISCFYSFPILIASKQQTTRPLDR